MLRPVHVFDRSVAVGVLGWVGGLQADPDLLIGPETKQPMHIGGGLWAYANVKWLAL